MAGQDTATSSHVEGARFAKSLSKCYPGHCHRDHPLSVSNGSWSRTEAAFRSHHKASHPVHTECRLRVVANYSSLKRLSRRRRDILLCSPVAFGCILSHDAAAFALLTEHGKQEARSTQFGLRRDEI